MSRIHITEDIEQDSWESFLRSQNRPPFLQSWYMHDLHEQIGDTSIRLGIYEDGELIGIAFAALITARRGVHLYLPYGPVLTSGSWKHLPVITEALAEYGRAHGAAFLRCSPFILGSQENAAAFSSAGWRPSPMHVLAEHLWILNIEQDEDVILKGMRKTMRNLIRRAERDGVTIHMSTEPADIERDVEAFIEIHHETAQRHHFTPYRDDYFRAQVHSFAREGIARVFRAEYEGKTIASTIHMFYGDMASYHHGASLSAYRKVPASYLLQWEAIKEAKRAGCTSYNFWGIVPPQDMISPVLKKQHPFTGVTKFKTGFGGEEFDLLHCHDYPIAPSYYYKTVPIETARRIRRGFWYSNSSV